MLKDHSVYLKKVYISLSIGQDMEYQRHRYGSFGGMEEARDPLAGGFPNMQNEPEHMGMPMMNGPGSHEGHTERAHSHESYDKPSHSHHSHHSHPHKKPAHHEDEDEEAESMDAKLVRKYDLNFEDSIHDLESVNIQGDKSIGKKISLLFGSQ